MCFFKLFLDSFRQVFASVNSDTDTRRTVSVALHVWMDFFAIRMLTRYELVMIFCLVISYPGTYMYNVVTSVWTCCLTKRGKTRPCYYSEKS